MKAILPALALLIAAAPAVAADVRVSLPAGRLGDAIVALGKQTGQSIVVPDAGLWGARVPAVTGRLSVRGALDRLVAGLDARVEKAGRDGWRIVPAPQRRPPPARPAPPPAIEPEPERPIVVTASKRDTRLADYAGSVSRIEGGVLDGDAARGTDAILARVATLSSTHLGAGRNKLFVRGIADSSFTGPTQATVGQYLGDVRLSYNAPDPDLRPYDVASVEVLEGPQGTLYGAGSLGGIIRVQPNPARFGLVAASLSGGVSATQHGAPGGDVSGVINLPVAGDRVALRLTGYGISEGGYIDNPLTGRDDVNRTRIAGGRATLAIDAGDDWTIELGGVLQDTDGADSQYADRDAPPLTRASAVRQGFDAGYRLAQLVVSKRWDGLGFRSSTGIVRQTLGERYDATRPGEAARLFVQSNRTRLIANETRLWRPMRGGFGWVIGTSLLANRTRLDRSLGPVTAPLPVTGVTNRIAEGTLYGEASMALLPGLIASAGARLTHARLSGAGEDVARTATLASDVALARAAIVADRTETTLLPSIGLVAHTLPGVDLYARYQQGFRPGGLAIEGDFVRRFRNDRVGTLEVGTRIGQAGRDPAYLSASLSYTRWQDIQADFIDGSGLPSTANIGDGRIWSLALAGGWTLAPGLRIDGGFAYNDSRVDEPSALFAALALARMSRVPNVARYAARIGADWRRPLSDTAEIGVSGWARYVGRSRLGIGPVLGEEQGDYLDTALTVRLGLAGLGVTLGLTNLLDSAGNRFALGTPFVIGREQVTPLRPRTLRVGFDTAF